MSKFSPKNVIIAILAGLCIAVYAGALVFALIKIDGVQVERRETIRAEWNDLESLAAAAGALGFMDEPFILAIEDAIISSRSIEAVIISGPDGEYAFERRKGSSIDWVNGSPRFRTGFGLTAGNSRPLRIDGQRNVNIQSLSASVDYDSLLRILKQTLIIILAALAFSFFVLLLETLVVKKEPVRYRGRTLPDPVDEAAEDDTEDDAEDADDDDTDIDFDTIEKTVQAEEENDDDTPAAPADTETTPDVSTDIPQADISDEAVSDDVPAPAGSVPYDTVKAALWEMHKPEIPAAKNPRQEADPAAPGGEAAPRAEGLYSPRGGIGWEEYTQDRLSAELHRCASFEQDLALIMMEFKDSPLTNNINNEFYRKFAGEAVEFFAERDMIFENGQGGITVIYPNMDLDQAFSKSEEFHNRILARYPEIFTSKSDLCVGISSRAGRLIDGSRLMFETREALQRAAADPISHIVAFKSDPEKYRQYLRGKGTEKAAS